MLLGMILLAPIISCTDDTPESLVDTKWWCDDNMKSAITGEQMYILLHFTSDTRCDYTEVYINSSMDYPGTYSYREPNIVIQAGNTRYEGTIDGNKLEVETDYGAKLTFERWK
jgi:hypothetical protein